MFEKICRIILPHIDIAWFNFLFPVVLAIACLVLAWIMFFVLSFIAKKNAHKWIHSNQSQENKTISRFFYLYRPLISKTLSSLRWIITIYILSSLIQSIASSIAATFREKRALSNEVVIDSANHISIYADKVNSFFDKFDSTLISVYFIVIFSIWFIKIFQNASTLLISTSPRGKLHVPKRLQARKDTLNSVANNLIKIIISVIASFTILQNLGVNIATLLATAGLASVAIGLGAQTLVKDFIGGFLILFEDQFAVGDTVEINAFTGVVEVMTLRTVKMRNAEGSITIIPNGDIRTIKNFTTDWVRIDFRYSAVLQTNIEIAAEIFAKIVNTVVAQFKSDIVGNPDVLPAEKLLDFENRTVGISFRAFIKTTSSSFKVKIESELNKRLVQEFKDKELI